MAKKATKKTKADNTAPTGVILRLEAENVKRLKAIDITTNGETVVVGGKNGQGKTSTLDAIEWALGSAKAITSKPVREGEAEARIVVELDDMVVTRTIPADGKSKLVVASKNGAKFSSPQKMLDKLVGDLSFDPLEFSRMKGAEQAETLREVCGIDTSELDFKYRNAFESRTEVNRDVKKMKAQVDAAVHHEDAPDEVIVLSDVVKQIEEIQRNNKNVDAIESNVLELRSEHRRIEDDIESTEQQIKDLQKQLAGQRNNLVDAETRLINARKLLKTAVKLDDTSERQKLEDAESINVKVRENQERQKLESQLHELEARATELDEEIDGIRRDKLKLLDAVDMPIDKLTFDEKTVFYDDIPFDQCSGAEQLRISIAVGMAANPQLRVLLIRDGSLMDDVSLAMVREMATDKGYQCWIESCSVDSETATVIINEGEVS